MGDTITRPLNTKLSLKMSEYIEDKSYFQIVYQTFFHSKPFLFYYVALNIQTLFVFPGLSIFLRVFNDKFMIYWGDIILIMIATISLTVGKIVHFRVISFRSNNQILFHILYRFIYYPIFIIQGVFTLNGSEMDSFILSNWFSIIALVLFMFSHGYIEDAIALKTPEIMKDEKWKNYIGFVII